MLEKKYIDVVVMQYKTGTIKPLFIVWEDGHKYAIDRVLDIRKAADLKVGGRGIKYTCRICGQIKEIYLEDDRWFLEREKN